MLKIVETVVTTQATGTFRFFKSEAMDGITFVIQKGHLYYEKPKSSLHAS